MKNDKIYIQKASGEKVPFEEEKLRRSLSRAGAEKKTVEEVIKVIQDNLEPGLTTEKIYNDAFALLTQLSRPSAGRYKLKSAIMELGPSGYPFERFIGEILKYKGFSVQVGQIVKGHCVNHEIDVIAQKDDKHYMVECKFHNRHGYQCDVKIPLYIHSRFQDVEKQWILLPGHSSKFHQGWVVTNTRFTSDAIQYGTCIGLHLVGWDYPRKGSLNDLIDESGLYPLTCLTTITLDEKNRLLEAKIVLCKEICGDKKILENLGIDSIRISSILKEANDLCHDPIYKSIFK
jgi:hypothetical protein